MQHAPLALRNWPDEILLPPSTAWWVSGCRASARCGLPGLSGAKVHTLLLRPRTYPHPGPAAPGPNGARRGAAACGRKGTTQWRSLATDSDRGAGPRLVRRTDHLSPRTYCTRPARRGHMLGVVMRATMSYTILRLLLFFAVLLILYWAGIGGFMLVALAAVISALISYVVLSRLRDSMSVSLTGRLGRFRRRLDQGASSEDTD
jgi:hypothetical protein